MHSNVGGKIRSIDENEIFILQKDARGVQGIPLN